MITVLVLYTPCIIYSIDEWATFPFSDFISNLRAAMRCILKGRDITLPWSTDIPHVGMDNIPTMISSMGNTPSTSTELDGMSNGIITAPEIICEFCNCHSGLLLILLFIISTIIVSECIDRVLQKSAHIIDRCLAVAICTAFIALGIYDTKVIEETGYDHPYGGLLFGTSIGYADLISIIILIIGIEITGRNALSDVEAVHNYALTEIQMQETTKSELMWS